MTTTPMTTTPTTAPDDCVEILPQGCCIPPINRTGIWRENNTFVNLYQCKDACEAVGELECVGLSWDNTTKLCKLYKTAINTTHTNTSCVDTHCFSIQTSVTTTETPAVAPAAQVQIFFPGANINPTNEVDWLESVQAVLLGSNLRFRLARRAIAGAIIKDKSQLLGVHSHSANSVTVTVTTEQIKADIETAVNSSSFDVTVDGVEYTGTCTNPESSQGDAPDGSNGSSPVVSTTVMAGVAVAVLAVIAVIAVFKVGKGSSPAPSRTPLSIDSESTAKSTESDEFSSFEWDNGTFTV
jgi:hypothetical protein